MSCGEEKGPINTVVIHSIIAGQLSSIFTFKGNTGGEGLCDDSNSRPSDEARVSKADCVHTCLIEFDGLQLWQSKKYSPEIPSYVHHSSHMERMTTMRQKKW